MGGYQDGGCYLAPMSGAHQTVCNATDCPLRREYESALVLEREATHQRADEAHVLRLAVVELRYKHGLALTRLRALGVDTSELQLPKDHA